MIRPCALQALARTRRGRTTERRFACSCGSVGPWRATAAQALDDYREHAGIEVPARG